MCAGLLGGLTRELTGAGEAGAESDAGLLGYRRA